MNGRLGDGGVHVIFLAPCCVKGLKERALMPVLMLPLTPPRVVLLDRNADRLT